MSELFSKTVQILGVEVNLAAQAVGAVALVMIAFCYFGKNKRRYLIFATLAAVCFAAESLILGAYSNVLCNGLTILRNIALLLLLRRGKTLPKTVTVLIAAAFLGFGVYYGIRGEWREILPPLFGIAVTYLTVQKNLGLLKIGSIFVEIGFLIFNFWIGAYVGVVRQIFVLTVCIIACITYYRQLKKPGGKER